MFVHGFHVILHKLSIKRPVILVRAIQWSSAWPSTVRCSSVSILAVKCCLAWNRYQMRKIAPRCVGYLQAVVEAQHAVRKLLGNWMVSKTTVGHSTSMNVSKPIKWEVLVVPLINLHQSIQNGMSHLLFILILPCIRLDP